jgi:carbamoyl-phosphate synthase large subunit
VSKFSHAKEWIDYWNGWNNFTAEEYLPGRNFGWESVYKNGKLIASLTWERLNYIISHVSPSGITGTPDIAKTIKRDDIQKVCENAINKIDNNPNGILSVDLRENKDGLPYITEINPGRFFTPSYFFTKAGLNLPYIYLKLAYNEDSDIDDDFDYDPNLYWIRGIDMKPHLVEEKFIK